MELLLRCSKPAPHDVSWEEHEITMVDGRVDRRVDMDSLDEWHLLPQAEEGISIK